MALLKEGKTNWKFIIIVFVLAILVGGGVLFWIKIQEVFPPEFFEITKPEKPSQDETADWKTYRNKDFGKAGIEIKYPQDWKIILTPLDPRTPNAPNISVGFNPVEYSDKMLYIHIWTSHSQLALKPRKE